MCKFRIKQVAVGSILQPPKAFCIVALIKAAMIPNDRGGRRPPPPAIPSFEASHAGVTPGEFPTLHEAGPEASKASKKKGLIAAAKGKVSSTGAEPPAASLAGSTVAGASSTGANPPPTSTIRTPAVLGTRYDASEIDKLIEKANTATLASKRPIPECWEDSDNSAYFPAESAAELTSLGWGVNSKNMKGPRIVKYDMYAVQKDMEKLKVQRPEFTEGTPANKAAVALGEVVCRANVGRLPEVVAAQFATAGNKVAMSQLKAMTQTAGTEADIVNSIATAAFRRRRWRNNEDEWSSPDEVGKEKAADTPTGNSAPLAGSEEDKYGLGTGVGGADASGAALNQKHAFKPDPADENKIFFWVPEDTYQGNTGQYGVATVLKDEGTEILEEYGLPSGA